MPELWFLACLSTIFKTSASRSIGLKKGSQTDPKKEEFEDLDQKTGGIGFYQGKY